VPLESRECGILFRIIEKTKENGGGSSLERTLLRDGIAVYRENTGNSAHFWLNAVKLSPHRREVSISYDEFPCSQ
jgi:hypothetical protein